MSDEIVFDVLCTKVLDALRALGLGKFSISRLFRRLCYEIYFHGGICTFYLRFD